LKQKEFQNIPNAVEQLRKIRDALFVDMKDQKREQKLSSPFFDPLVALITPQTTTQNPPQIEHHQGFEDAEKLTIATASFLIAGVTKASWQAEHDAFED